jgi:hypothetical protein
LSVSEPIDDDDSVVVDLLEGTSMDEGLLLTLALVGVFIVTGLALFAYAVRRGPPEADRSRQGLGMAAGMLFGAALGAIVWFSTGESVTWVIFMGGGLVLGLAVGGTRASDPR